MKDFTTMINQFRNGAVDDVDSPKLSPEERYASFDYCYTYFYSNRENPKNLLGDNLQLSCLNLGFYLASWGMYRGSSFILQKSLAVYIPIIELVASEKYSKLWGVDVDNYDLGGNINLILEFKKEIKKLPHFNDATDTLITKIMLGVYGCVPAFDKYLKLGLKVNSLSEKSLDIIHKFYNDNKNELQSIGEIKCYHFNNADGQDIYYTIAKLIDMYGFQLGKN
jgi:hypothetical protein